MALPLWLIPAGMSLISSIVSGNQQKKALQEVQEMAPPTLTYDEARTQAQDLLTPLYDEQLQKNLEQVDRHNLARGFYGQMPGDALKRSTAADIEQARAGQIASLAQQMKGQSQQQALQQQQLAAQYALSRGSQGQSMLSNAFNTALNAGFGYYDRTGQWFGQGNPLLGKDGNFQPGKLNANQTMQLFGNMNLEQEPSFIGQNALRLPSNIGGNLSPGTLWTKPY